MDGCIFCKIISGEIPSSKVYEDDKVLAFNDINPLAPIHILIIPKKHYDSIIDVDECEMDIVKYIHNTINKIAKDYNFYESGFRIVTNCGQDGGQEVKHLHYHILAGKGIKGIG